MACVEELSYAVSGSKMADFALLAGDSNVCRMQRNIPNGKAKYRVNNLFLMKKTHLGLDDVPFYCKLCQC